MMSQASADDRDLATSKLFKGDHTIPKKEALSIKRGVRKRQFEPHKEAQTIEVHKTLVRVKERRQTWQCNSTS